jgi:hypothetical protein
LVSWWSMRCIRPCCSPLRMKKLCRAPPVGALAVSLSISWHPFYRKGRAQVPPLQIRGRAEFS